VAGLTVCSGLRVVQNVIMPVSDYSHGS
jgi:hypothetical protein